MGVLEYSRERQLIIQSQVVKSSLFVLALDQIFRPSSNWEWGLEDWHCSLFVGKPTTSVQMEEAQQILTVLLVPFTTSWILTSLVTACPNLVPCFDKYEMVANDSADRLVIHVAPPSGQNVSDTLVYDNTPAKLKKKTVSAIFCIYCK